jgi:acyl carrier protein
MQDERDRDRERALIDVEDRIRHLLVSRLRIDSEVLAGSDARTCLLGRDIGIDSMEALALALAIEEEFDIEVDDGDLTTALFETIGSVADYVRRRKNHR